MATIYRCDWCGLERKIRGGVIFKLKDVAPCHNKILNMLMDEEVCFLCTHDIEKIVESAANKIKGLRSTKRKELKAKKVKT